jgi:RNA polymerase sigma-70 factor (ECF subfamily)
VARKQDSPRDRFGRVFEQYGLVVGFARRRGSRDPESIGAEVMSIAWDGIDRIDADSCRPWLLATARNLLLAEYRRRIPEPVDPASLEESESFTPDFHVDSLDPGIGEALASLRPTDREALVLVAWDELTPSEAAESLGINLSAFRVRHFRARQRFVALLREGEAQTNQTPQLKEDRT